METRANFALIGAFTIAVIAAAFGFVIWFAGGNKTNVQKSFRIIFTGSVAGLSRGATVTFNGLRVGEVTSIDLLKEDPSQVAAVIGVSERTPVKTDTQAQLEVTTVTGVASIALIGGSANAVALETPEGQPWPTIYAARSNFQNLLEKAQSLSTKAEDLLEKADKILGDNAAPISATIKNVEVFSRALADNSDGLGQLMASVSDLGKTIGPLASRLDAIATQAQTILGAVDPAAVRHVIAGVDTTVTTLADSKLAFTALIADAALAAHNLGQTSTRLDGVLAQATAILGSVDPKKIGSAVDNVSAFADSLGRTRPDVDQIMKNTNQLTAKLNASADKVDGVIDAARGFLGSGETKGAFGDVAEAARSIKKLADNLDIRTKEITAGFAKFTGPGYRQIEAVASDSRKTLDEVNRTVKSLERNPQQFIFGAKPAIPEYQGR